jgi:hypothetical protein
MRVKSHDQRKGQWLINKIRNKFDYSKISSIEQEKTMIELRLWNMENDEFDRLMSDYNE